MSEATTNLRGLSLAALALVAVATALSGFLVSGRAPAPAAPAAQTPFGVIHESGAEPSTTITGAPMHTLWLEVNGRWRPVPR